MLSRVAQTIYWLGRYIERAENYARFMDVNLSLIMDLPKTMSEQWQPLVGITGDDALFRSKYDEQYTRDNVVQFMTFDKDNSNSILSCLIQARENARTIREIISSEMWQQLNELYLSVKDANIATNGNLSDFYRHIKTGSHLFNGIMDSTLIHNEAYHFANIGRLSERADKTDRILDMKYFYLLPRVEDVGTTLDYMQWSALLKSASAYEVYRKKYGRMDYRDIIEFLIFDREFPRAIHFCLLESDRSLHTIGNTQLGTFNNPAEKEMGKIISQLNFNDVNDIIQYGLHEYLDDLQVKLNHLGDEIFNTFFSLAHK
ncbi:MAG: alpha-E domain-containing protein [Candidatus Omnitrophica bacterium]|nr:alpha-E domain-containing protein [Candidatus Omnitrophota bacterium]MCB9720045.1 alpha-E domain-containing protein [Candidatus Omnitrophota bacterium]